MWRPNPQVTRSFSGARPIILKTATRSFPMKRSFAVIGASPKIRQQTQMYYCEFAAEKLALLDQAGITNRVWWYNGLRTVYHVSHNWPSAPGMKLTIPGLKSFEAPDFARFEVGWKTGIGVRSDGTVLPVPDKAWQDLRSLPARYQGYYPCTAGHPYHAAVSGLFAFSPGKFDQAAADRVVFRAIFGPGCDRPAREWSDAYVQFQVWLAQTADSPITDAQMADAQRRLAQWRALSREVRGCAGARPLAAFAGDSGNHPCTDAGGRGLGGEDAAAAQPLGSTARPRTKRNEGEGRGLERVWKM